MSGGVIRNNHAVDNFYNTDERCPAAGGGICIYNYNTVLNLSGSAEIKDNTSEDMGGGISVGTGFGTGEFQILNMTGGKITGNSAGSVGGGIFVQAGFREDAVGIANISAGEISDNRTTGEGRGNKAFGGGGIYVNGYNLGGTTVHGKLNLTNALIKNNEASQQGGGYAACPISSTHIYVNDGAAIYSNTASSADAIYILASNNFKYHSGNPTYEISSAMLGGTPYRWKDDDGKEVLFDDLTGTLNADLEENLSLHTDVTFDAEAEARATVRIMENSSATRGGGIGSNGEVNIGKIVPPIDINVTKDWRDDERADRPTVLKIELYRNIEGSDDDPVYVSYQTMIPDSSGNWPSITFENLPKTDSSGAVFEYSIKEISVDGYTSSISGNQDDGFTVMNTKKPDSPDKISISVKKVWKGDIGEKAVIHLLADNEEIAVCELNEENNWQYIFTDLDKTKDGNTIQYTITEDAVDGYTSSISGNQDDGFTITNTKSENPDNSYNAPSKTGDSSHPGLYLMALLIMTFVIIHVIIIKRKR